MEPRRTWIASLPLVALLAWATPAHPCGALLSSREDQNLAIDAQRALMVIGDTQIDLHLQLTADTDGAGFSWIIPVPRAPTLALGDAAVFDALESATRPTVTILNNHSGGGFCGGSDQAGAPQRGGIDHFGSGQLGGYTYDLLSGDDGAALTAWLDAHGYILPPGFDEAVAPYLAAHVFVAVRLSPSAAQVDVQPLIVSYARPFGATFGNTFGLGKLSTPTSSPFVLWILADKRYRIANYGMIELGRVAQAMRDRDVDYATAVSQLTAEAGGRLAVVEMARDIAHDPTLVAALGSAFGPNTRYLTRIYGDIPRDAMEDFALTFAVDAPDVDKDVYVSGGLPSSGVALALGLVGLVWVRRRT